MADVDYNSSLPVRSEADGVDARVQVKVVDKTNPTTQQMTVDTDSNAHVEMHGNDPAGVDRVAKMGQDGSLTTNGIYDGTTNTEPGTVGLTAQERNATAAHARQNQRPTAKRGTVDTDQVSLDVALHDENGNKYTTANPLPVVLSNEEVGTAVHAYLESVATVAPGATENLDYTVAGSTFTLKNILASASGRIKVEILVGAAAGPTRRYVLFNSTAFLNVEKACPANSLVAIGDIVRVSITNMDKQAFTVYASVEGTLGA